MCCDAPAVRNSLVCLSVFASFFFLSIPFTLLHIVGLFTLFYCPLLSWITFPSFLSFYLLYITFSLFLHPFIMIVNYSCIRPSLNVLFSFFRYLYLSLYFCLSLSSFLWELSLFVYTLSPASQNTLPHSPGIVRCMSQRVLWIWCQWWVWCLLA